MNRSSLWLGVSVLLVSLAFAGCGRRENYILVEGFETACEGAPCGWTVQSGTPGAARWNETLPGEHGVLLDATPMAIVRDTTDVVLAGAVDAGGLNAEMAAICDGSVVLTVELTIELLATGGEQVFTATFEPPSDWDGTLDTRGMVTDGGGFGLIFRNIRSIRIVKIGEGTCQIDYLGIRVQSSGFEG